MTHRVQTAAHVAVIDPMTGAGLLLRPPPREDLTIGRQSLHEADWGELVRRLHRLGWEPLADDYGMPVSDEIREDGSEVVGLSQVGEPIITAPSLDSLADALAELWQASGIDA